MILTDTNRSLSRPFVILQANSDRCTNKSKARITLIDYSITITETISTNMTIYDWIWRTTVTSYNKRKTHQNHILLQTLPTFTRMLIWQNFILALNKQYIRVKYCTVQNKFWGVKTTGDIPPTFLRWSDIQIVLIFIHIISADSVAEMTHLSEECLENLNRKCLKLEIIQFNC